MKKSYLQSPYSQGSHLLTGTLLLALVLNLPRGVPLSRAYLAKGFAIK